MGPTEETIWKGYGFISDYLEFDQLEDPSSWETDFEGSPRSFFFPTLALPQNAFENKPQ